MIIVVKSKRSCSSKQGDRNERNFILILFNSWNSSWSICQILNRNVSSELFLMMYDLTIWIGPPSNVLKEKNQKWPDLQQHFYSVNRIFQLFNFLEVYQKASLRFIRYLLIMPTWSTLHNPVDSERVGKI